MKSREEFKTVYQAVIATGNKHKLEEIGVILKDFQLEVLSMKDVGLDGLEIIEDGNTFEENALIKAKTVMEKTGKLALADDSGLEVDILNNQPGIYSARFAGEHATDKENNDKLLKLLKDIPLEKRRARFVCAMAAVFPNGDIVVLRGECSGVIGFEPKGTSGFGYDPLFIIEEYGKTFAELGEERKNKISHRAIALEKLKEELKTRLEGE
ncbi:XTP/dITP diphosphatase [Alkaliphilus sp. B6464]|uniref:XTP/dITP diphosphatase n=1 Tax=Alkaliphilus sp. B6464 TaxID=2731219 RepID=UPI001BAC55A6|nr:XTP/dITP diphosphatase [Alkaliphilus sp. B6464]QUH19958.1 XTP/dITP diphosphatase [Alkaliphilus sp. B6464]